MDSLLEYELLKKLKEDDPSSFKKIYENYWEEIFVYVLKVIKDSDEAKDIVQELFVSIWHRRKKIEIQSSLKSYLFTSVKYITLRHIQNNAGRKNFIKILTDIAEKETSFDTFLGAKELNRQIETCINEEMPDRMRLIFKLSREEHLSYKGIADQLGISEETVRKQIYNALKILRSKIKNFAFGLL